MRNNYDTKPRDILKLLFWVLSIIGWCLLLSDFLLPYSGSNPRDLDKAEGVVLIAKESLSLVQDAPALGEREAELTAYNTVPEQTDEMSCVSASNDWICGRNDVVACPPQYPFGSKFEISGKIYECLDRTATQSDDHFDISFDKDLTGAELFGRQELKIKVISRP